MTEEVLVARHPGLRRGEFRLTSPATRSYNCIAWAAEDDSRWWATTEFELYYWPTGAPRENTVEGWAAALASVGYERCAEVIPDPGVTHVALYGRDGEALHVARQLPNGRWTSKLGQNVDIEHELEALVGDDYGSVAMIMRRSSLPENPLQRGDMAAQP